VRCFLTLNRVSSGYEYKKTFGSAFCIICSIFPLLLLLLLLMMMVRPLVEAYKMIRWTTQKDTANDT